MKMQVIINESQKKYLLVESLNNVISTKIKEMTDFTKKTLKETSSQIGINLEFLFGWGAAIGGLVGLGVGLFNLSKENEERRKQEAEKQKEDNKKYQDMVDALSVRPLQLNIGNESISKFSTQQSLTNSNPNYS